MIMIMIIIIHTLFSSRERVCAKKGEEASYSILSISKVVVTL